MRVLLGANVENSTHSKRQTYSAILLLVASALVLLPVVVFPLPPLLDYPNHLARLWLIEGGINIPPLNHFYAENWNGIATNIGIDIAAKTLKGVVPALLLGQILLGLSVLLPPLGAVMLNVTEFGGIDPWHLLFLFFAFTLTLLAGFLNFQIGLGTALLCASFDRMLSSRGLFALYGARLCLGIVVMLIHPFALLFYGALLAGLEFGREAPKLTLESLLPRLLRTIPVAAVCLAPIALLLLWTHAVPGAKNSGRVIYNPLFERVAALDSPFFSYNVKVDALFGLCVILIVFYAARNRPGKVHVGLLTAALALSVLEFFVPSVTPQSAWLDVRLPIMAVLAALAATRLSFGDLDFKALALTGATFALIVFRTIWISWNWSASVPMLESMRAVLTSVPAGAAVLPMQHTPSNSEMNSPLPGRLLNRVNETYVHYPALVVPWRHAFVPTLFSVAGAHPIRVLPPWNQIAEPGGGGLPSVNALRRRSLQPGFMREWQSQFDYILVLNADRPDRYGQFVPPREITLIAKAGFAELYRIRHRRN